VPDPSENITDVPIELIDFILKAGRRDPSRRFSTMRDAIKTLEPLVSKKRSTNGFKRYEEGFTSTLIMAYNDEQKAELNQLIEAFSTQIQALGVRIELSDFTNI